QKTYNTGHSPVVTDPTTTPALIGLSMGERTGSRVFQWVWSYVPAKGIRAVYKRTPPVMPSQCLVRGRSLERCLAKGSACERGDRYAGRSRHRMAVEAGRGE
ncbi:uncharacterized protein LY79DRAFT_527281, partial [Colletotrichum navitas]